MGINNGLPFVDELQTIVPRPRFFHYEQYLFTLNFLAHETGVFPYFSIFLRPRRDEVTDWHETEKYYRRRRKIYGLSEISDPFSTFDSQDLSPPRGERFMPIFLFILSESRRSAPGNVAI